MTCKVPWIPFGFDRIDNSMDTFPLSTVSITYNTTLLCRQILKLLSESNLRNSFFTDSFQRNWMLRNIWETLEWKSVASRHSAQNGRVSTNCPHFLNREIQCLFFQTTNILRSRFRKLIFVPHIDLTSTACFDNIVEYLSKYSWGFRKIPRYCQRFLGISILTLELL